MEQYGLHSTIGRVTGRGRWIDVCVCLEEEVDVSKKTVNIDMGAELRQIPRHLPKTLDVQTTPHKVWSHTNTI